MFFKQTWTGRAHFALPRSKGPKVAIQVHASQVQHQGTHLKLSAEGRTAKSSRAAVARAVRIACLLTPIVLVAGGSLICVVFSFADFSG